MSNYSRIDCRHFEIHLALYLNHLYSLLGLRHMIWKLKTICNYNLFSDHEHLQPGENVLQSLDIFGLTSTIDSSPKLQEASHKK